MEDFLMMMAKPFLACLILTGIHVYLGLHVVERGVIFVDLALAQMAVLGSTLAYLFGFMPESLTAYAAALTAAFFGAWIFAETRMKKQEVPQEAVIGIIYAVAAAAAVLLLSRTAEGDEHIRHMLIGNVLLVDTPALVKMFSLYAVIGIIHFCFRGQFFLISQNPEWAEAKHVSVKKWDFLFYMTFGLVVTSSVAIAGVLLVFSYLIAPAVLAMLCAKTVQGRLVIGWIAGVLASFAGLSLSYFLDLPTGAAVICALGGALLAVILWKRALKR